MDGQFAADGWEATSYDFGDALYAFDRQQRLHAYVPICPVRKVAGRSRFFSDNGFTLTHRRAKRAHLAAKQDSGDGHFVIGLQ